MNIGSASALSGVSAKMIRYYEAIGLIRSAARRENSYRDYSERDIHELRFIGRARALGFSIEAIGRLLALWRDGSRPSHEVRAIAAEHIATLEARIADLQAMAGVLKGLVRTCRGDHRPDCPILADLSSSGPRQRRAPSKTGPKAFSCESPSRTRAGGETGSPRENAMTQKHAGAQRFNQVEKRPRVVRL